MKILAGQLTLDFSEPQEPRDYMQDCLSWLTGVHGCPEGIKPLAQRIYRDFASVEAFERLKVLKDCCGKNHITDWTIEDAESVCGISRKDIDYHTCWDRAWAGRQGITKEECARVIEWDYSERKPIFNRA